MKRKLTTIVAMLLVLLFTSFMTSCAVHENDDGSTSIRLTPAAHKTISDIGKGSVDILSILSMFIPALAPIAAAAATGVVTWGHMGRKITKYKTPLEHTVNVIEAIKQDEKLWVQVKPLLKGIKQTTGDGWLGKPSGKTEATIRELIDKNVGAV
ncbi:hypothetical protein LCGC14_0720040 [marine sediment metagenome]|uniref:Uncharacterized protein n=1 Tax=marine sediment metagenome TaxID=412755 RepID=A0A0F9TK55_9ZZZZ